jgi:outer membrane protein OmpA-like peptidoglycan-associated protein
MKKALLIMISILLTWNLSAQIDLKGKAKEKSVSRVDQRTDETIDKGLDAIEEGIGSVFKKKNKKDEEVEEEESEEEPEVEIESPEEPEAERLPQQKASVPVLAAYSKYDFIPGEQVTFFDDFSQDQIGDFPAKWNTNSSGEVVSLNNYPGSWFAPGTDGSFVPDYLQKLPENFTLEFDLVYAGSEVNPSDFGIDFISKLETDGIDDYVPGNGGVALRFGAYGFEAFSWKEAEYGDINTKKEIDFLLTNTNKLVKISIWFQKQRVRLYANESKIFDIPRLVPPGLVLDRIRFSTWEAEQVYVYMSNLRVAVGAPDTRSKLITEGKFVTHGIYFDSGSDKIKPESYGVLKDIAAVLSQNPDVKITIIGHTDSDGEDSMNLKLSKLRAASVRNSLSSDFGIDAVRMQTDGKGEAQPVGPNNTLVEKANNRRVEFIKI